MSFFEKFKKLFDGRKGSRRPFFPKNFICGSKLAKKMEKLNRKKFQTHMCNFLLGDSVLALNYKYYQVTSSEKNFSNSHSSWSCRPKE